MLQLFIALHVLSAIVFVGNIVTAAFWKVRADRSGSLETIASTSRLLLQADYVFTVPGVVGLFLTGTVLGGLTSWDRFQEPWLAASIVLLLIVTVIWAVVLLPAQRRMAYVALESVAHGHLAPDYVSLSRRWSIFGGIATLLPVIILFLMVFKPGA